MRACNIFYALALLISPPTALAQAPPSPGGALLFGRTAGFVQIAPNPSFTLNNKLTLEAWVNPSAAASLATIISRGNGNNSLTDYIMQLQKSGNEFLLAFYTTGGWDYSAPTIPANTWTHVAVTYDGNIKQFFINGVLQNTATNTGGFYASGSPIYIGRQGAVCNCNYFNGMIDEVRVWNVVRSAGQISQNYNYPLTGTEPGLVAYYKFDYINGITTRDSSTNGNTGMLVNRPVPVISRVPFPLNSFALRGPNPLTNNCHSPFIDPGASFRAAPAAIGSSLFVIKEDQTVENYLTNTVVPPEVTNVIAISTGNYASVAAEADGSVIAWGRNFDGETNVPASATNAISVAAGGRFGLALRGDGTIVGWGYDTNGEINIPASAADVVAISAGFDFAIALRSDGTVVGWGHNNWGQINIPASATNVVAIASGALGSIALRADGSVVTWGFSSYLGQTNVPPAATNVIAVGSTANAQYMVLKADGSVLAWDPVNEASLTNIPPSATNIVAIAETCNGLPFALRADGTLLVWGAQFTLNPAPDIEAVGEPVPTVSAFDVNTPGTYPLTYIATNVLGTSFTNSRTLVVADLSPPSLTLLGANPITLTNGTSFIDPGATAADACAGDLTGSILVSGTVNANVPGTYTVTYNVKDPSGYSAAPINRTVIVIAAPSLDGFADSLVATNPDTAVVAAQLSTTVNPNGVDSMAYFQYGLNTSYSLGGAPFTLPAAYASSNLTTLAPDLSRGVAYHWRAVGSNAVGISYGPDQLLFIPGLAAAGDLNGDGVVSQGELNSVLSNYYSTSPWPYLTGVTGLGHSNVTFQLTNSLEGAFNVQVSSNLIDWQPLGPAIPFYNFTDTNPPAAGPRYYRLQWP